MFLNAEIVNFRISFMLYNMHVPALPVFSFGNCFHNSEVAGFCKIFAISNVLLFLCLLTCVDSVFVI
jgi:hypothetical protein